MIYLRILILAMLTLSTNVLAQLEISSQGITFPDGTFQSTALKNSLPLIEVTGQTECWDPIGAPLLCAGSRHDGDLQKGVPWPVPRFSDNANGTVTDNMTGLIWLKNANCFFTGVLWEAALSNASTLADGDCDLSDGSTAGDWRLPNINEFLSLTDFGRHSPALPEVHFFTNVLSDDWYWTSMTTKLGNKTNAFRYSAGSGLMAAADKDFAPSYFIWPVRGGQ